jgi:polysaccharide pyruvyl transferase WcaK-like protein
VRDCYSRERFLADVPEAADRTRLTADLAFLAEEGTLPSEWEMFLQHPAIAVLPKTEFPATLVQSLLDRAFRVIVIQHDLRRGTPLKPAERTQFANTIANDQLRVLMPENPHAYRLVRAILRRCHATCSGRLHGCISSLAVGTPAMMLSDYGDKSRGVFAPFGLEWLVADSFTETEGKLEQMLDSRSSIREEIAANIDAVKQQARDTFAVTEGR